MKKFILIGILAAFSAGVAGCAYEDDHDRGHDHDDVRDHQDTIHVDVDHTHDHDHDSDHP